MPLIAAHLLLRQSLPPHTHGASDLFLYAVEGSGYLDTSDGQVPFAAGSMAQYPGDEDRKNQQRRPVAVTDEENAVQRVSCVYATHCPNVFDVTADDPTRHDLYDGQGKEEGDAKGWSQDVVHEDMTQYRLSGFGQLYGT